MTRVLFASYCYDCGLAHAKGVIVVAVLEDDANREALVKTDPVQGLFNVRQPGDSRAVLLKESPSETLYFSPESFTRITQQRYVGARSGVYTLEQILSEICEHVPVAAIHENENGLADISVLAFGDIEVCDIAVERSPHEAIVVVELGVINLLLRRSKSLINIPEDSQRVLGFLELRGCGRDACLRPPIFVSGLDDVIVSNEVVLAQRDDTVQILFRLRRANSLLVELRIGWK